MTTLENRLELSERLLVAADGTFEETAARLAVEDAGAVAEAALAEVAFRAALFDGPASPVAVRFDLEVGGEWLGWTLTFGGRGANEPWVFVRQDLTELVRAVYGPPNARCDATREVTIMDLPGPEFDRDSLTQRHAAGLAAHQVIAAMTPPRADLRALAVRFGSDKWAGHWYAAHYERHFARLRDERVRLLEIGIGGYADDLRGGYADDLRDGYADDLGGGSLLIWKHFFPRGLVHGLDVHDKSGLDQPRLRTIRGNQCDAALLAELAGRIGPLDIVIDDGSHLSDDVLAAFHALFPRLRPGGIYVIEDLQTSYWPGWNGNRTGDDPATSTGFVKSLIDGLHHQERRGHGRPDTDRWVAGLHVYHGIAFIEKGVNADQPAPAWIPREVNPVAYGCEG